MEPRKRSTSSALKGRSTPFHRGLFAHSCSMHSWASARCTDISSSLISGALERGWTFFVPLSLVGICIFSCLVGRCLGNLECASSNGIEFSVYDHRFAELAGAAESFAFFIAGADWKFPQ